LVLCSLLEFIQYLILRNLSSSSSTVHRPFSDPKPLINLSAALKRRSIISASSWSWRCSAIACNSSTNTWLDGYFWIENWRRMNWSKNTTLDTQEIMCWQAPIVSQPHYLFVFLAESVKLIIESGKFLVYFVQIPLRLMVIPFQPCHLFRNRQNVNVEKQHVLLRQAIYGWFVAKYG